MIKAAQKVGASLEEIKRAFEAWQQMLDGWITYLQKLRDNLAGCIGCGCLSMTC